ncbi:MAG TPA: Smr/MutS family protein, partial [Myxococcaceae bacterium]|nr:Smr/MutS family protein [Myxococcaceae bacterium]
GEPTSRGAGAVTFASKSVPAELNRIGLTVEQAQDKVDKLLDDAALSERREVRLVHGFGACKLRKDVAQLLDRHPLVA